jgi:tRNA pseudouridine38-40 synthase
VKLEPADDEAPAERPAFDDPREPLDGFARVRLTLAFDGAAYAGWQWQQGEMTVQQRLEEALAEVFPSASRAHGSSRTDAGVHARGLVAHFDAPKPELRMPPSKMVLALNAHLPPDIRVSAAAVAPPNFHARFSAVSKEYRYFIWNHSAHDPLLRAQTWHVPRKLDLRAMADGAKALIGRHDFRAFSASPGYARHNTVRTLRRCTVRKAGALVTVTLEGDGFLYKMCRGLTGSLVQIGLGRWPSSAAGEMLASCDRRIAGMTAPAHGLVLWRVNYRPHR